MATFEKEGNAILCRSLERKIQRQQTNFSMSTNTCTNVCFHACMCMRVGVCACMYVFLYVRMHTFIKISTYIRLIIAWRHASLSISLCLSISPSGCLPASLSSYLCAYRRTSRLAATASTRSFSSSSSSAAGISGTIIKGCLNGPPRPDAAASCCCITPRKKSSVHMITCMRRLRVEGPERLHQSHPYKYSAHTNHLRLFRRSGMVTILQAYASRKNQCPRVYQNILCYFIMLNAIPLLSGRLPSFLYASGHST